MKTGKFKWLAIIGSIVLVSGLTNDVLGQRPNRGGATVSPGTTTRPSRPSPGNRPPTNAGSRPPGGQRPPRPSVGTRPPANRPGVRPPYRPRPNYHYRPGYNYHRPYYGFYSYYRPFIGVRINVLPFGYYPFYYGQDRFYYSGGFFYKQDTDGYKVVVPPVGAEVPSIPTEAKAISINGQTYYEYKGVYYNSKLDANGKTIYVVAGKDGVLDTDKEADSEQLSDLPKEGDIVTELPANVRDVVIKGTLYYVSEDGVYYEKVIAGDKVTYKVIGIGN